MSLREKPSHDIVRVMSKFFKSQKRFIEKHFGTKSAETANYGWAADNDSYMTKIYTYPKLSYVCSYRSPATGRTVHEITTQK
jgi:hypothetical protein